MEKAAVLAIIASVAFGWAAALPSPAVADSQDLVNGLRAQRGKPSIALPFSTPSPSSSATGDVVSQIVAGNKAMLASLTTNVQQLLSLFGTGDGAIAESLQYPDIQDGNGHDCAVLGRKFTQVIHDHPLALTGDFIDDLENQRIVFSAANQICSANACQTVFNELSAQVSKGVSTVNSAGSLVNMIPGVGTVGTAIGAAGTAVSSANPFTIACGVVTKVSLVAPTLTTPAPSATPTATPSPTPSAN